MNYTVHYDLKHSVLEETETDNGVWRVEITKHTVSRTQSGPAIIIGKNIDGVVLSHKCLGADKYYVETVVNDLSDLKSCSWCHAKIPEEVLFLIKMSALDGR